VKESDAGLQISASGLLVNSGERQSKGVAEVKDQREDECRV